MILFALLLAQATSPAPLARPRDTPEPVCIRAGDLTKGLEAWYKSVGPPGIGLPFVLKGVAAPTPPKPGAPARTGMTATVDFVVKTPGSYRIALGAGAWIDVIGGGRTLESTGHGHGPACTGIRKIVHFSLRSGRYTIRLKGIPGDTIKLLIVPGV